MKSAVVTGASGAIGTALVNELISNNVSVLILARKSSCLDNIVKSPLITVNECSLEELNNFDSKNSYDTFFHLAWNGTYGEARNNEAEQFKNVEYTIDAVNLAKRLGCSSFVGVGSQAEYGKVATNQKLCPNTPSNPVTFYGKAKLRACFESQKLCSEFNIKHNWCRVLSTYGIGDKPYTLIMSTINKFINGDSCDFTAGEQQWDYLFNEDLARGLYLIAEKGKDQQIYTIGTGATRSLKDYILSIYNIVGNKKSKCNFGAIDYFPNQVMYLCADITKLQNDTGFEPMYTFEEGIKKTLNYVLK